MKKTFNILGVLIMMILGVLVAILAPFYTWLSYALCLVLPLCFICYFCLNITPKQNKKTKNFQHIFALIIAFLFFIETLFYLFYLTGILEHFRDIESAKKWIQSFGTLAFLIFFIIQFLQVVILPLPAQITLIAGVLIFGALQTFIISSVAIILGSVVCFFIGRIFGNKVLHLLCEKETANHYKNLLSNKGRILLPIFFLLPVFPDDLLCFASGATSMSFKCFLLITIIFRPVAIFFVCWLGSGRVIPFTSWGIPVWIVLLTLLLILLVILFKYQNKIENWIVKRFSHTKK